MPISFALSIALAAAPLAPQAPPTETLVRMNLTPRAAPKPALRYLLLPELREMTPGNPVEGYLQCLIDQDLPNQQEGLSKSALRLADRAARMDKPDWQILPRMKTEGFFVALSDVQKLRMLAGGLNERFRSEIALGRIDDALVTAKTMFAISRHLSEHPSLIGQLVGIAISHIAFGPMQELLEQPNCPNLYWAFTNLPNPLVSLDRGMAGERLMFQVEFRDLDDAAPMTTDQLKALVEHIDRLRALEANPKEKTRAWLNARTKDKDLIAAAQKNLVEYGIPKERVKKFPAEQILLLDQRRAFELSRDEFMKFTNLPTWQSLEMSERLANEKAKDKLLFGDMADIFQKVRQAQGRLEQRTSLFRHIEAIRMYAAENKGQLPGKLTDITVPLPVDPFTGKSFRYTLEGATAHLRASPPHGFEKIAAYNYHFEITIRKP